MFWIMMYMLLFDRSADPELSLVPDRKAFQKAIKDAPRLEQVDAVRREADIIEKARSDAVERKYELLAQLTPGQDTDLDEFREVFSELDDARLEAQEALLDCRFRMKDLMTRKEWKKVYRRR